MAQCTRFVCSTCGFAYEVWDDGNPYLLNPDGSKRYVYHPSRDRALAIGNDAPHVCLACGHEFTVDSEAPDHTCPECGQEKAVGGMRLEGKTCPHCSKGTFHADPGFQCIS